MFLLCLIEMCTEGRFKTSQSKCFLTFDCNSNYTLGQSKTSKCFEMFDCNVQCAHTNKSYHAFTPSFPFTDLTWQYFCHKTLFSYEANRNDALKTTTIRSFCQQDFSNRRHSLL